MYQDEVCDHVLKNLLYAFAYNERANEESSAARPR